MKRESKQLLVSLFAGLVFGVGLAVSGMTQPRHELSVPRARMARHVSR